MLVEHSSIKKTVEKESILESYATMDGRDDANNDHSAVSLTSCCTDHVSIDNIIENARELILSTFRFPKP